MMSRLVTESDPPVAPRIFPDVTSHDILKSFAVLIMIADHIGAYFFPDHLWWRAVGRIGFPVWFFLMGHARSRHVDRTMMIGAVILIIGDLIFQRDFFPVNALWTMILLRLFTQPLMHWIGASLDRLFIVTVIGALAYPITTNFWEYGTLAFIFSICGYLARFGFGPHPRIPAFYGAAALGIFVILMHNSFQHFTPAMDLFNMVGSGMTLWLLFYYLPRTNPGTRVTHPWAVAALKFGGRRTLEIYVVHLLLFKALVYALCRCASGCCCAPLG